MSYIDWFKKHGEKHQKLIKKLLNKGLNQDEIIEYFEYENLKLNESEFCILFAQNKKCHNMQKLNCYLCACPNFRFTTNSSYCAINSKDGTKINNTHQNCTNCTIPHHKNYIESKFSFDWFLIMRDCPKLC
jgi:Zn-finger protein